MKKLIFILSFSLLLTTILKSQDTIFYNKNGKAETILCKITKVNHINIFYTENKVGKSIALKYVTTYTGYQKMITKSILAVDTTETSIYKLYTKKDLKVVRDNNSQGWLLVSGIAFIGSGICTLIANDRKPPVGGGNVALDDFTKGQQSLGYAQGIFTGIGGLSLIVGVTIHFK